MVWTISKNCGEKKLWNLPSALISKQADSLLWKSAPQFRQMQNMAAFGFKISTYSSTMVEVESWNKVSAALLPLSDSYLDSYTILLNIQNKPLYFCTDFFLFLFSFFKLIWTNLHRGVLWFLQIMIYRSPSDIEIKLKKRYLSVDKIMSTPEPQGSHLPCSFMLCL